jgi:hypothetical protein
MSKSEIKGSPEFHLRARYPMRNGSLRQPAWRNWQTRWTQNPVIARSCGFEPLRRQNFSKAAQRLTVPG